MSLEKLQQLASSISQAVENNKQFAIPFLTTKLAKALKSVPQDQTIGMLHRVLDKMADTKTFIKKADLQSLYNKFYVFGTQANEVLSDELGTPQEPKISVYQRDGETSNTFDFKAQDTVLADALGNSFNHLSPIKTFSSDVAENAIKTVKNILNAYNLKPSKLSLNSGNEKFLIVNAGYDTPKGLTTFLVPLEIKDNKVLTPQFLVSNAGPAELNYTNIKSYITKFAGIKSKIADIDLLNSLTKTIESKYTPEISDTELALTRLNSSRQSNYGALDNQVFGQKIAEASYKDVELAKYNEFESFEKQFSTPRGLASWKFGELTNVGRNHIERELNSFGFRNNQIVVSNNDDNTIFYGVSLNAGKTAFTVPIKVSNGKIQKPTVLICNGSILSFDKEGINDLVKTNFSDNKVASNASIMATLKNSEVLDVLRTAINDNDYNKAEEAINVLAHSNDAKAYATGLHLYMSGLANANVKTATSQCSKMIKNAVSEHPICTHTGLPVNKIYQDKNGNCRPLYRKGMDETYEGAFFSNSKVFI